MPKLADLSKPDLIAKLKATKAKHRMIMRHLEQIHVAREARIKELEAELRAFRDNANRVLTETMDASDQTIKRLEAALSDTRAKLHQRPPINCCHCASPHCLYGGVA